MSNESDPTGEPAHGRPEDIWKDDLLNRRADAERIIRFVKAEVAERKATGQLASYVLNVDSAWGQGKTFFLQRLKEHLLQEKHKVALINAWEDDHAEDPLIPFLVELDKLFPETGPIENAAQQTGIGVGKLAVKLGRQILVGFIKQKIGEEAFDGLAKITVESAIDVGDEALKDIAKKVISSFEKTKEANKALKEQLASLSKDEKNPIFVLIDELDRCRPTYAILLLERIKHFFEADNVVFIVATDTEQLGHSIKAVYGNDFDSRAYLRRFFMRTYVFPDPTLSDFIEHFFSRKSEDFKKKLSSPPDNDHAKFIAAWAEATALSLRDLEQCLDLLAGLKADWKYNFEIELALAMPLIIAHLWGDRETVAKLSNLTFEQGSIIPKLIKSNKPRAISLNFSPDPEEKFFGSVELILAALLNEATRSKDRNVEYKRFNRIQQWAYKRNLHQTTRAEAIRSYGAKIAGASLFRAK